MPRTTNRHPLFNTNYTRQDPRQDPGTTQPLPILDAYGHIMPIKRPRAIYPAYISPDTDHAVGEDGWMGPDALRLFNLQERNEAWSRYYQGYRSYPLPMMLQEFVGSCLILSRSRNDIGESLLYRVSRDYPHQQLWVCLDMFGSMLLMTPQDALKPYLPYAREKRMRLRAK